MAEPGSGNGNGNEQLGTGGSEIEKDTPAHLYVKAGLPCCHSERSVIFPATSSNQAACGRAGFLQ